MSYAGIDRTDGHHQLDTPLPDVPAGDLQKSIYPLVVMAIGIGFASTAVHSGSRISSSVTRPTEATARMG